MKQISFFLKFKILIFIVFALSCNNISTIDREIENAIENSDTEVMLRLAKPNFKVSQEEKAYYLKLAKAKSEKYMARIHNGLPKFTRSILGVFPALFGLGLFAFCSFLLWADHYKDYHPETYEESVNKNGGAVVMTTAKRLLWLGAISSTVITSFGFSEIYKGITENSETKLRDNALAVEAIISRLPTIQN